MNILSSLVDARTNFQLYNVRKKVSINSHKFMFLTTKLSVYSVVIAEFYSFDCDLFRHCKPDLFADELASKTSNYSYAPYVCWKILVPSIVFASLRSQGNNTIKIQIMYGIFLRTHILSYRTGSNLR